MATSPERMRRWTRAEYDRLIDVGFFRPGEHVELLGGHLIVSEPHGTLHATAVGLVDDALRASFGPGWVVRGQMPVALDDESEPEPDVAVVPGARRDYLTDHPACPVLVVEVAESSLADDRGTKAALYARAGIADYWILNLVDRVLEVYRAPMAGAVLEGARYRDVTIVRVGMSIAPLAHPDSAIDVAALLPAPGSYQMTPSRRSVSSSAGATPSSLPKTSALCSPSNGERTMSVGESERRTGLPGIG
jgi:Uma2 family endonuclease